MERFRARVEAVERITDDIAIVYFRVNNPKFHCRPGQYVSVFFRSSRYPAGKAYSLASIPEERLCSMAVKRIGKYSGKLYSLSPGKTFLCSSGYGHLNPKSSKSLVCFTGGIGIAPVWSIIKSELEAEPEKRVRLYCSHRTIESIPFRLELEKYEAAHEGLKVEYFITREVTTLPHHHKSRLSAESCVPLALHDYTYLMCGSVDFVRDVWQGLFRAGVKPEAMSAESFFE